MNSSTTIKLSVGSIQVMSSTDKDSFGLKHMLSNHLKTISPIRMVQMWPQLNVPLIKLYQEDQESKFVNVSLEFSELSERVISWGKNHL